MSIYPFFEECGKYTTDPFWKEKFIELANNIFPDGLKYNVKTHKFIIRDGNKQIPLPKKVPDAFKKIVEVLREHFNIYSTREMNTNQGKETLIKQEKEMNCEFKDIKPKQIKDQLIMNYAIELKERYKLTVSEFSKLLSTIQLGFQFKSLSPKDVNYSDGKIQDIQGLEFLEKKRFFKVPEAPNPNVKTDKTQCTDRFESIVKKYLKGNDLRFSKFIE